MDKQTFESLKKVAERLNKLEKREKELLVKSWESEKDFLIKEWPKIFKDLATFDVKDNALIYNGKKIYEFYVPKDGKDGKDGERGPAGKAGIDGKAGRDGRDGADGKDGTDGREISIFVVDNKICWSYEGSDVYYDLVDLDKLKGKDGKDGKSGKSGPAGKGLAKGGTTNQIIVKASEKDYETKWVNIDTLFPVMTQEEYDALEVKDPNLYYCIVEG